VHKALVLPTLLSGCEAWSLRKDLFKCLRSFHNWCARLIFIVYLHHTFRNHMTSSSLFYCSGPEGPELEGQQADTTENFLFYRLNLLEIVSYNHTRILRWAGHVARMPMSRAPRQLLTSLVAHSRPAGCPKMTYVRTLENALASKGNSKEFKEWIAIAKDRPMPYTNTYASSVSSCTLDHRAKRARRRPFTARRGMASTRPATLRT